MNSKIKKKKIVDILFVILLSILSVLVLKKGPLYNWDIIPYMASVKSIENNDFHVISKDIYTELESKVGSDYFQELVSGSEYRQSIHDNPEALKEQLAYYDSKAIYNYINYIFYKVGFELSTATIVINYICYFLIGITLYLFLSIYLNNIISSALTIGVMMSEQVIQLARYSTPDALSTLVILLIVFLIQKGKSLNLIHILLGVSILIRPDNILFVFMISAYLFLIQRSNWKELLVVDVILLLIYVISGQLFNHSGWSTLYYHAFIERIIYPISAPKYIDFDMYLSTLSKLRLDLYSYLLILVGLAIQLISNFISKIRWSNEERLLYMIVGLMIVKALIFPINEERFFIGLDLIVLALISNNLMSIYSTIKKRNKV